MSRFGRWVSCKCYKGSVWWGLGAFRKDLINEKILDICCSYLCLNLNLLRYRFWLLDLLFCLEFYLLIIIANHFIILLKHSDSYNHITLICNLNQIQSNHSNFNFISILEFLSIQTFQIQSNYQYSSFPYLSLNLIYFLYWNIIKLDFSLAIFLH